ncbi:hypothetical protein FN846DRAFT_970449 [Sphaerosporella brunnea]|uniref:Uncharacterized protein n=1 Tax=Sphaerosporella brunnea TaxID=1250544 RepID=A0A5J5EJ71_9PEZI|nr:hypothetical protein FN846DRAFT_970449 [Sphaerosporella brunnea]
MVTVLERAETSESSRGDTSTPSSASSSSTTAQERGEVRVTITESPTFMGNVTGAKTTTTSDQQQNVSETESAESSSNIEKSTSTSTPRTPTAAAPSSSSSFPSPSSASSTAKPTPGTTTITAPSEDDNDDEASEAAVTITRYQAKTKSAPSASALETHTVLITPEPTAFSAFPTARPQQPKPHRKTIFDEAEFYSEEDDGFVLPTKKPSQDANKKKPEHDSFTSSSSVENSDDIVCLTETFIEEIIGPSVTKTSVLELVVVQHTSTSTADSPKQSGKEKDKDKEHRLQTSGGARKEGGWLLCLRCSVPFWLQAVVAGGLVWLVR